MSDRKRDGRRIAGRYQLLEPIGKGGMGIVWRAHDELLDRTVAVKEVRYAAALGDEVQLLNRRTMREARAAARFEHPNVIVVHDVIEEDDRPWIVMQLVQSRSLGAVIKQDGPLKPKRVAEIGLAVLDALHRAHESGVLHRDVKPENVLLADDGRVVLTDFGIATLETETQLTVTGLAGTPAFIAPERLKGLPARRESDLWSLGATLYTSVEGRSPHERGMALATMHAVLTDPPDPAPNAGPLAEVIDLLLAKEPVQRPSYEETERLLREAIAASTPRQVSRPSPRATAVMPAQRPGVERAPVEDDTPTDPDLVAPGAAGPPASQPAPKPAARPSRPISARPLSARPGSARSDSGRPEPARSESARSASQRPDPAWPEPARAEPARSASAAEPAGPWAPEPAHELPETGARLSPATADPDDLLPPTARSSRSDLRGRPWPVVAAAGAVVLVAAIGGYLGLNSAPDRSSGSERTGAVTTPATSGSEPSDGATGSPTAEPSPSASPTGSPSPSASPSEPADALPEGWKMYKDKKMGFSVGLPKGWDVHTRSGRQVTFRGPGAGPKSYLLIEEAADPGSDPYKDWIKQEPTLKHNFGGYKKLSIKKVDYQKAAADWDFTWNADSGPSRVRNRGFVTENGRGYAIYWHTLNSRWKKDLHFFEGFCATFKPRK
ncbi:protein kinase domain-containing protein [Nonomuraea muscovyensis]|uniref:non-specific serine/threonine protein kinase n=1 Tax=Nonomuraea muscovyensis TaxID=1124761 RepID=A0A7X0BW29_9ACTN|nr:serine/threonine-protein kinase [Nonomuraea muscovyensis]MBB6343962.1 serine/threonine protein kinase [Nonomuraea muscovyensis]